MDITGTFAAEADEEEVSQLTTIFPFFSHRVLFFQLKCCLVKLAIPCLRVQPGRQQE
jgi:hypothetical protein